MEQTPFIKRETSNSDADIGMLTSHVNDVGITTQVMLTNTSL